MGKSRCSSAWKILPDNNFEPDIGAGTEQRNKRFPSRGIIRVRIYKSGKIRLSWRARAVVIRGLVEVFLELCKEPYVNISIEELKSSYKVGEPVAFKVVTAKRYGKAAAIDLLSQLKTRTPLRISAI
jgi:hypothetical protein